MKKLLFCLILASVIQTLPMEPEKTATAEYLAHLPRHELLIAQEENTARLEVAKKNHQEKMAQIQDYNWYGDTSSLPLILNIYPNRTKKEREQGINDLCLSIELANAYEAKVQSYLDNKEAEKELDVTDELRTLNQRVYLHPIIERLLLSDNPKNKKALQTIILNSPKYCYWSPIDILYVYNSYPNLRQINPFTKFLTEAKKPSSIQNESKFEQKIKLGNVGYLINKFDVPGNVKDQIFSCVLTNFLSENQTEVQSAIFKLSISDLAKFRSNILLLELPCHHEQAASYDFGYVMKRLGATYDPDNNRHDFKTLTAKRAAFDKYVRPIVTELLPNYNLDAPDNNEFNN